MINVDRPTRIAVLGLGAMGAALARALDDGEHQVTVWNRTSRDLVDFGLDGTRIVLADHPNDAVAKAEIVIICVRDQQAASVIIDQIRTELAPDAVLVNTSTATPAQAIAAAEAAEGAGLAYVTAAIMVPTPLIGTDGSLVLYAGREADLARIGPALAPLGGTADLTGADHGVPPALELPMLDIYFAGMHAYLHSAALVRHYWVELSDYLPYAQGIVDTLRETLPGLSSGLEARTYDSGQARLDMCLAFLDKIVATSRQARVQPGISELVRESTATAAVSHLGSTDWDVVAEQFGFHRRRSSGA